MVLYDSSGFERQKEGFGLSTTAGAWHYLQNRLANAQVNSQGDGK